MKKCPFCGADIEDTARFCLYCMRSLTEKEQIFLHKKKKPQWSLIIVAIVAVFLMVAIVLPGTGSENTTPTESLHLDPVPSSKPAESSGGTTPSSQSVTQPSTQATTPETQPTHITTQPTKPTGSTLPPTQPTSRPTTQPVTKPTTQPTQPTTQATQPTTQPETEPVTVPTGPHEHVYYLKNTSAKYMMRKPTCTAAAKYYYSCPCGAMGTNYFSYGEPLEHVIVETPEIPPTCTSVGYTKGEMCALCGKYAMGHFQIDRLDHTYGPVDEYIACLGCGRFPEGHAFEVILKLPELPYVLDDTLRIESCTYDIGVSSSNSYYAEITFWIEYTNISSEEWESCALLKLQQYSTTGTVKAEQATVLPGERGGCKVLFPSIPPGIYEVLFEWRK